ncbi:hypothetical protein PHMEG_0007006 [Phytophthora megakarya]|uniref:Core-binding (CB) domain-containing protein n=1 Tax=Phytophthora megakarya TaxID=4795 RepID=A0A225WPR5_9STRA|nr:hypothetical protein PHMEG_0007006 [Phytophthora megakarya]
MDTGSCDDGRSRTDRYLATYLRAHSVADSTYDQYERSLKKWYMWSSRPGISTWLVSLPLTAQVQHISDFVLHGFQFGYGSGGGVIRSDTILAVLHGVRHFFAPAGQDFPITYPHIRMLLKGISRLYSPRQLKAPVSTGLLESCFHCSDMDDPFEQALTGQPTLSPSVAQSVYMRLIGSKTNQNGVATIKFLIRSCARYSVR